MSDCDSQDQHADIKANEGEASSRSENLSCLLMIACVFVLCAGAASYLLALSLSLAVALPLGALISAVVLRIVFLMEPSWREVFVPSFVVIVIMSLFLVPVFIEARSKARRAFCESNVKTLTMALRLYTQDNDDRLPPASRWSQRLDGRYFSKEDRERAFHCPSTVSRFSYGFNRAMDRKLLSRIARPGSVDLILEMDAASPDAVGGASSLPSVPRHKGKDVYGFLDGSAHALSRPAGSRVRWLP